MLIKTKTNNEQKYVKISEPSLDEFLNSAFVKFSIPPVNEGIRVYDETGTEVDADVFAEVAQLPNAGVFTIQFDNGSQGNASSASPPVQTNSALALSSSTSSDDTIILDLDSGPSRKRQKVNQDAKQVVESALTKKPGGDRITKEYNRTKGLTDSSRRQMVNILAADMTETYGEMSIRPNKCKKIEQDFILQFGEDVAAKFLERWPTTFKKRVIQQSKALPSSGDLEDLIYCAKVTSNEEEMDNDIIASGWDSDLSSIILLHLIPPTAQGQKRPGKVSASQAEKHLVVFKKSGTSIQEYIDIINSTTQPYLLAVGMKRSAIHEFFIVLDKQVIPCNSTTSLGAFDELVKAHFVFGTHTIRCSTTCTRGVKIHQIHGSVQTLIFEPRFGSYRGFPRFPILQRNREREMLSDITLSGYGRTLTLRTVTEHNTADVTH
ncbi:uncharacterized protein LOC127355484 [Dicentrarchus labrax]|uniref:uncharacterized protein LOC127355484 n=1 Tax=Dicentrarchus labrax TaxID=13489 RepID=UPI0021F58A85|nr:uncharacterized protein LOC127355484 [Dicentrarchus labrax]